MLTTQNTVSQPVLLDASFLREHAHRCTQLARKCPHRPTAHALEAFGIELMLKAAELDKALADWVSTP
jgi:hypothetical protein